LDGLRFRRGYLIRTWFICDWCDNRFCKRHSIFLFLEAQFGEDAITPIATPKLPVNADHTSSTNGNSEPEDDLMRQKAESQELARLHGLGIPVPGLEIKVDKHVAKVWLEKLEVECANRTFGDRVRSVMERACETVAPLWQ